MVKAAMTRERMSIETAGFAFAVGMLGLGVGLLTLGIVKAFGLAIVAFVIAGELRWLSLKRKHNIEH